jgi:hypothetical protein
MNRSRDPESHPAIIRDALRYFYAENGNTIPHYREVMWRYSVSRATAFRWMQLMYVRYGGWHT